ncbi:MAG: UDP-N-acetylmuramate dehydrogenase [Pyrinomonadaceae bacterium]
MEISENIPLAPYTTLGVGGPARYFAEARSESEVAAALEFAAARSLPVFVLGGGSNIVVADRGYDGLVVKIDISGVEYEDEDGVAVAVTAGAGEDWDGLVEQCVNSGLAGVECLSGIPGSVGGTPVQNVGAYGQDVSETIVSVRCLDRATGTPTLLTNAECGFGYRTSIFNTTLRDRYIVTSVAFRLERGDSARVAYKDLVEHFGGRKPSLLEVREAVLAIRRSKSMVIDNADPNSRSAGSFFKNPVVDRSVAESVAIKLGVDRVPQFPFGDNMVKIPAAWLIERSGFSKGFKLGNAGISANHSLAIVNRGGASAVEILALKELIETSVYHKFGISLVPEPLLVGF